MTNEEKLQKLLQIAFVNGWMPFDKLQEYIIEEYQSFSIFENIVCNNECYEDYKEFSLNDLVANFEEDEVSFIEALCKSCNMKGYKPIFSSEIHNTSYSVVARMIRQDWIYYPTSKRLDWLFETFNHLLYK